MLSPLSQRTGSGLVSRSFQSRFQVLVLAQVATDAVASASTPFARVDLLEQVLPAAEP
jgi:hypothetical protein